LVDWRPDSGVGGDQGAGGSSVAPRAPPRPAAPPQAHSQPHSPPPRLPNGLAGIPNGAAGKVHLNGAEENLNKRAVQRFIVEHPGLNLQELADAVGINRTAVIYHVRRMVRAGTVVTLRQGPHVLHFPSTMPKEQQGALSLLRIASVRAVAQELHHDPNLSCPRIAGRLHTTVRTVRRALRALTDRGLLRVEEGPASGRDRIAHLHPQLRLLLARWRPEATLAPRPAPRGGLAPPPSPPGGRQEEDAG
jgi:DNA-binding MarR family transcriptional regulator